MHSFKKGIKLVICLLICALVIKALDILLYPCTFVRNDIHTVTNEQKDVVILGTSNGMSDLDPDSMLEGTKMTGHNLCVGGEYPVDAYYLTKLVIEKQVEGDLADHTRDFNFTIEFFDGTYTGKIGEESITFNQNEKVTFTLHHKEQLIFENIPVGTHYQVIETGENNGYTPHVQLTENGHVFDEVVGQTGVDLTANINNQNNYVGENENYVLFVNSYNSTPITGLNENNWPYILLLALSTLGLVFFGVRKYVYKNH